MSNKLKHQLFYFFEVHLHEFLVFYSGINISYYLTEYLRINSNPDI